MKTIFSIMIALLFFSCTKNTGGNKPGNESSLSKEDLIRRSELMLSPKDYVAWINNRDNHLRLSKSIDNVNFSVLYKPADYIICKELKHDEISANEYGNIKEQLGDMQYFDLKILIQDFQKEFLKYNLQSPGDYQKRVSYCAFQMQNDIQLVEGTDTIPCSLFHFERAFDVVPYGQFLLGFEAPKHAQSEITFIFHDRIFNKGIIKFSFETANITHLPKLTTI